MLLFSSCSVALVTFGSASRVSFSLLYFEFWGGGFGGSGPVGPLALRHFLPVQLGLNEKFEFVAKIARNLCTHILGSPTPIFCKNCAGAPPHKLRTISAHFSMPPHIFRTNFLGLVGTGLRTSFAQLSRARDLLSKSASVQAINVSTLAPQPLTTAGHKFNTDFCVFSNENTLNSEEGLN